MILQFLWDILQAILLASIALFPTWSPPSNPTGGFATLQAANIVIPLDVLAICAGSTVALLGIGLTVWVVMKVVNLIRGSGA